MTLSIMDQMSDLEVLIKYLDQNTPYGDDVQDTLPNMNINAALDYVIDLVADSLKTHIEIDEEG